MKKLLIFLGLVLIIVIPTKAKSQSHELQQLILNLEKLNQFKAILDQMYKGYEIISKGYNTVKDLTEGNFSLHKVFLDKLLDVNPVVKQYYRVGEIITMQQSLIKEYNNARQHFKNVKVFSKKELQYLEEVYDNLFNGSLKNLDELLMVITANRLRMNDAERLTAIDRIYIDMEDKMIFLRDFNNRTALLGDQKSHESRDTKTLKRIYGF